MHKILVVEDNEDLARGLEIQLKREGYAVLKAKNGEAGIQSAVRENPDLILLDVMLPDTSGLDVCREIRIKGFQTPIIMLTAKAEEIDRVVGLEIGADDYMTKPFSMRELFARIRARLRHHQPHAAESLAKYRFGSVEIDFENFTAALGGKPIELTQKEFEIMKLLIRHRGSVVSRDMLLNEVWGYEDYPATRTVDTHILKLRKKLEDDPTDPIFILSVYGEGYRFVG